MADDIYLHCQLPADSTSTQVFHLSPGVHSDPLRGSLRVVHLDEQPSIPYDCLSYTWDDPEPMAAAHMAATPVKMRRNLDNALRHIRSEFETRIIWVDALCINQQDLAEKAEEVALMSRVYRTYSAVYIWLGIPGARLTGDPFALFKRFAGGGHLHELPGFTWDSVAAQWTWENNDRSNDILNDALEVVRSAWWTRAWTVQECILPRATRVMLGHWTSTLDFL
jgi:hypothetical protein